MKKKIAVIGFGGMGSWHVNHALKSDVVSLKGIYDIREVRNDLARSKGIFVYDSFEAILAEPVENTQKRVSQTLKSGHHSVYDHPTYNLALEEIPKILAMILNNEGMYTTSEKSARYTKMKLEDKEKEIMNI